MPDTWFITGATRGLGHAIATAALAAGHQVVAAGRDAERTRAALGDHDALLPLALDVTDPAQIDAAVAAAVERFGGIDVLVNNAGYGQLGLFEETTPAQYDAQFATNVRGAMDVTRSVLPLMRRQRRGHVFNLSSIGGVIGGEGFSLYAASKFALEGFSESLSYEVVPFGIRVTIVEPGRFRTDFLDASSIRFGDAPIDDYTEASRRVRDGYEAGNHVQAGDPAKLAAALLRLADEAEPPLRLAVGSDAYQVISDKIDRMRAELERWRELTVSTDY